MFIIMEERVTQCNTVTHVLSLALLAIWGLRVKDTCLEGLVVDDKKNIQNATDASSFRVERQRWVCKWL